MKDSLGRVIYVGKAKNLRSRAGSYFLKAAAEERRTAELVREIRDIDFVLCDSEVDALLAEARLIKDIQPRFNQDLKDDKSFPYLEIFIREDFPRVEFTREPSRSGTKLYGPFASAGSLRGAIQVLQKIFKFRTCSLDIDDGDERWRWFRPCLLASIHQCTAPCNLRISKEDYRRDIDRLRMFLEGKKKKLLKEMREEMTTAAADRRYEKAARLRDEIRMLETLDERGELDTHEQPEVFLHRSEEGPGRPQEGAEPRRGAARHRRRRHRAPAGRRNGRVARAVHRRAAVQAGLQAIQDPRRGGRRRLQEHPRSRGPPLQTARRRRARLSRHPADRRRQGATERRHGGVLAPWASRRRRSSRSPRRTKRFTCPARTSRCG